MNFLFFQFAVESIVVRRDGTSTTDRIVEVI